MKEEKKRAFSRRLDPKMNLYLDTITKYLESDNVFLPGKLSRTKVIEYCIWRTYTIVKGIKDE